MRLAKISVALAIAGYAFPAHAHLVETGFGDFYDGIAHLAVTPADLLVVIALALLAGQAGRAAARSITFALPASWLLAAIIATYWPAAAAFPVLTTLSFALAGALVAFNAKIGDAGVLLLAIAAGALHGLGNGAAMSAVDGSGLTLSGVISAIFFLTALLSAEITALPSGWPRIAVRVAGSWIAATGLLMFGWLAHVAS